LQLPSSTLVGAKVARLATVAEAKVAPFVLEKQTLRAVEEPSPVGCELKITKVVGVVGPSVGLSVGLCVCGEAATTPAL